MIVRISAAVISLVLAAAVVGLGVRSFLVSDAIDRRVPVAEQVLVSSRGQLFVLWIPQGPGGPRRPATWDLLRTEPFDLSYAAYDRVDPGLRRSFHALGFTWRVSTGGSGKTAANRSVTFAPESMIGVPDAAVVAALTLMPALTARRLRLDRRRQSGRCVTCGYDLRATPGRCPECGAVPG